MAEQTKHTKRHCMVVHAYYPLGEVRVQREAEGLIEHGYEVDILCLRLPEEPRVDVYHDANIYRLPIRRHKGSSVWIQLLEYLSFFVLAFFQLSVLHIRRRYGTVQVHNLPDFLVFAALVPKLSGTPVILDLHDLMPEFFASRFGGGQRNVFAKLVRLQERLACRFATHVITVTEHWRQSLIRRGVSADKCSVLMNLAAPHIFVQPAQTQPRPGGCDEFRLVYHGSIPKRYGLDLVLQAIAKIQTEIPSIDFTVIGNGDYLGVLRCLAAELGINEHVHFRGTMPVEDLPAHILAADLAVVPYRNDVFTDELLPTKLLEYAALGVPAIASRTTGISTYFDDTMVKFFTPGDVDELADCILELHQDRERLARLAQGIDEFNRYYNWPSQKSQYVDLVTRLAEGQTRQTRGL